MPRIRTCSSLAGKGGVSKRRDFGRDHTLESVRRCNEMPNEQDKAVESAVAAMAAGAPSDWVSLHAVFTPVKASATVDTESADEAVRLDISPEALRTSLRISGAQPNSVSRGIGWSSTSTATGGSRCARYPKGPALAACHAAVLAGRTPRSWQWARCTCSSFWCSERR